MILSLFYSTKPWFTKTSIQNNCTDQLANRNNINLIYPLTSYNSTHSQPDDITSSNRPESRLSSWWCKHRAYSDHTSWERFVIQFLCDCDRALGRGLFSVCDHFIHGRRTCRIVGGAVWRMRLTGRLLRFDWSRVTKRCFLFLFFCLFFYFNIFLAVYLTILLFLLSFFWNGVFIFLYLQLNLHFLFPGSEWEDVLVSARAFTQRWPRPLWNLQSQQLHQLTHDLVYIAVDTQVGVFVLQKPSNLSIIMF